MNKMDVLLWLPYVPYAHKCNNHNKNEIARSAEMSHAKIFNVSSPLVTALVFQVVVDRAHCQALEELQTGLLPSRGLRL